MKRKSIMEKKISIYKDFEEQRMHELEETLKMNPIERIKQAVKMIRKIYPSLPASGNKKINFHSKNPKP
jgi:hypothetical protein